MNIQQMNAAWAQMRRQQTLAAYARMVAGRAAKAEGPKEETPEQEEPTAGEADTEADADEEAGETAETPEAVEQE